MTEILLESGVCRAHCEQLGSNLWFLAGEQNPCGWQASLKTVEVEDIKRTLFSDQPQRRGHTSGRTVRHCTVQEGRGQKLV